MAKNDNELFPMIAKTLPGLEDLLAAELLELGAQRIEPGIRNVQFYGDTGFMYKANYCLRTALRILKPIAEFKVRNEKELYRKLYDLPWGDYLTLEKTFLVDSTVNSPIFRNSHYIELRMKDAIVDSIRDATGSRPDVDKDDPDIRFNIHINREKVSIALDSSGDPLYKRNYRKGKVKAPINEVLAAGLVMLSGWNGSTNIMDPMCGSGTILIEAAMYALNIPPQVRRRKFGFMKWPDYDKELFKTIKAGRAKQIHDKPFQAQGMDRLYSAVNTARKSLISLGLEGYINIIQKDFFESEKRPGPYTLIFNPPYGERLKHPDSFYERIGSTLKHHYAGTTAWFITSDLEALKQVGLKASKRIPLKNGALDCRFVRYDLYEGTRKGKSPRDGIAQCR